MTAPTTTILVMSSHYRIRSFWKVIEVDPRVLPSDFLSSAKERLSSQILHMWVDNPYGAASRRRIAEVNELLEAIS
jgi:hypothetical protein